MWKYPEEVSSFIAENVNGTTAKDLAELTNAKFGTDFTGCSMKSYKSNHDLKSGTRCGLPAGRPTELFPDEVQNFIKYNIACRRVDALTELVNKEFGTTYEEAQVRAFVKNHGLSSGLDCRFSKDSVSFNKGKKKYWIGGEETQFKTGSRPHNYMPVGTERINAEGYRDIKIADPNKWKAMHVLLWEENNGPVPAGHVLIFGDGDKLNVTLDNLIMISRSQLAVLNHFNLIQRDVELTKAAIVVADIKSKICQRRKKA